MGIGGLLGAAALRQQTLSRGEDATATDTDAEVTAPSNVPVVV
jgi:hypothetical protein